MGVVNISGYKFVELDQLDQLKSTFLQKCPQYHIKGTILLAHEGINLMLASEQAEMNLFIHFLKKDHRFDDIPLKLNESRCQPYTKLKVRIKKEIVTMDLTISAQNKKDLGAHISPETLRHWLEEKRDITLLDTRNRYEVAMGTFENAIDLQIDNFKQFPQASRQLKPDLKQNPIVMFCTGGIRCEKASIALKQQGYDTVYQLEGGIIKYFEQCHGKHFNGHCFVFDDRLAVNKQLKAIID